MGWKRDLTGRERAYAASYWTQLPEQILAVSERLKGVQIEQKPALELIQKVNQKNVLLYCDPPYLLKTRHGKMYRKEMDDHDHWKLLQMLLKQQGPVLISGYDNDLYNKVLCD